MKLLRLLLIGTAILAVLLAAAIGLAFTPAVQTWAVRRVLAGQSGLKIEVGRVAVGLHSVRVENVHVTQPGQVLTLPVFELDLPLLSLAHKQVFVQKLVVKGWTLDLTAPVEKNGPALVVKPPFVPVPAAVVPAVQTAAIFQGIFDQIKLPVDLAIDSVELSGEVVFPADDPRQPSGHAHVTLTGGRLRAGQEGKFDFQVDTTLGNATAAVHTLTVHGTFVARLDNPRAFSHFGLVSDGTAIGAQFPKGTQVHVVIDALRAASGEHYTMQLVAAGKTLFTFNADYAAAAPRLTGTWQLNMRDGDVAPFAFGRPLPAFEATGEGRLETDAAFAVVHGTGHLHVSAEKLEAVQTELGALGKLTFDANLDVTQNFDAAHDVRVIRVDHFDATMAGVQPVAEVHALQSFEFNPGTKELKVADPAKDLISLELNGLPLAWAQPFMPGFSVKGEPVTATLLAKVRDGSLHLESSAPVEVKNLSIAHAGRPLVHFDRAALNLSADYALQGWQAELTASAQAGQKSIFTLQTKAGCMNDPARVIKATGRLQADLPALLAQPAFASFVQLTAGDAQADFQASIGGKKEIQARLVLDKLAAPQAPSLPKITADVRADLAPDGKITLDLPLLFENAGRKSDLTLSGALQSGAAGLNIDARIAGNLVVADDVKVLAAPLAGKSPVPQPQATASASASVPTTDAVRDTAPPWKGVGGHLVLALKKIVYGQTEVNDVAGDLQISPDTLTVSQVHAMLASGGELKAGGTVNFSSAPPQPYSLKTNVDVANVDSAPLFRALNPSKPPTVEGKFNFTGQFTGSGLNLADLAQRIQGDASLNSKSGIFRGLAKNGGTQAVSTVSGIAGLLSNSKELVAIGKLTTVLQAFPYDQINVQLRRGDSLDVQLKEFSVISEQLRLSGTGTLTYEKGKSMLDQKLAMQIAMGVRGDIDTLMAALGKVSTDQDDLGYTKVSRPIKIGGTPANPDTSDLYAFLKEAGVNAAAQAAERLLNIFGKKK